MFSCAFVLSLDSFSRSTTYLGPTLFENIRVTINSIGVSASIKSVISQSSVKKYITVKRNNALLSTTIIIIHAIE